jgi:hypothetical protein
LNNSQNLKTVPPGSVATLDFLRHHQRHLFLQQLTEIGVRKPKWKKEKRSENSGSLRNRHNNVAEMKRVVVFK